MSSNILQTITTYLSR